MAGVRERSSATWLALAYAALIVYASLHPFAGWRWPPGVGLAELALIAWPPWRDDFDRWSNLLGYLPLGALLLMAARRSGWRLGTALALGLLAPALLSYGMEFAQQFLPGRHPSLKDWALNSAGGACGVALALAGHLLGLDEAWRRTRRRWFRGEAAFGLALLALWPAALLFPAPAPFGLGQLGPRLRERAAAALEGVPWAAELQAVLQPLPLPVMPLAPLNELALSTLGLLAPCLLAHAITAPGLRRAGATVAVLALGLGTLALSTALLYGPRHAWAWITPQTLPALTLAAATALVLLPAGRRLSAALALMAHSALVVLVSQAPADPFYALNLSAWEQGQFVRFHGLAQWLGWLWPFAAIAWLLKELTAGPRSRHAGW
jgi:VanZ family protein